MDRQKVRNLFRLTSTNKHPSFIKCKGVCPFQDNILAKPNKMLKFSGKNI